MKNRIDTYTKITKYIKSYLNTRDSQLWVVGGQNSQGFWGNSKYLFLYIENQTNSDAIYLCDDPDHRNQLQDAGYTCYHSRSIKAEEVTSQADNIVVTHGCLDVPWWRTGGANVYYLWHGIPLKTIGKQALSSRAYIRKHFWRQSKFIIPDGDLTEYIFRMCFDLTDDQIIRTGYPRNEAILHEFIDQKLGNPSVKTDSLQRLLREWETVVGYFPTYRKSTSPLNKLPLDEIENIMAEFDAVFIAKPHPKDTTYIPETYEHIKVIRENLDIYPFLTNFDLLVTDYSSIYFDFLHVDKPIVFYCYDFEEYKEQPGFTVDFDKVTPGQVAKTSKELALTLRGTLREDSDHIERQLLRQQLMSDPHKSCKRILDK